MLFEPHDEQCIVCAPGGEWLGRPNKSVIYVTLLRQNSRPMWQQGPSTAFDELDIDWLRVRLQEMNDEQLIKFEKAARFMCSPDANSGSPHVKHL